MGNGAGTSGLATAVRPSDGGSLFDRYKPDQGIWVRGGTFGSAALLAAGLLNFLVQRLDSYRVGEKAWTVLISPGIPIAAGLAIVAFAFWAVYKNRQWGDFLIATEGEMKKVNWSSRAEIWGSTVVVILVTALMSSALFLVDWFFMWFFSSIGVLKLSGMSLIGGGG